MSTVGERIKQIRLEKGLTQQQFADKLSVSRSFISRVESNKEKPSITLIKLISLTFKYTTDWINTGRGEKKSRDQVLKERAYELYNTVPSILATDSSTPILYNIAITKCIARVEMLLNNKYVCNNSNTSYYRTICEIITLLLNKINALSVFLQDDQQFIIDDIDSFLDIEINNTLNEMSRLLNKTVACFRYENLDDDSGSEGE